MSVCSAPCKETIALPIRAHKPAIILFIHTHNNQIPYIPVFNRIPAKILLPIVGDSTWAFGSHKCRLKNGNFTKNLNNKNPFIKNELKKTPSKNSYLSTKIRTKNRHGNENIIV